VPGDGLRELEFCFVQRARLTVVEHKLAEQCALMNQRNERERADALAQNHALQIAERGVRRDIGNANWLGILRVRGPGRMTFGGGAIRVR
jgi:hypothetical protein